MHCKLKYTTASATAGGGEWGRWERGDCIEFELRGSNEDFGREWGRALGWICLRRKSLFAKWGCCSIAHDIILYHARRPPQPSSLWLPEWKLYLLWIYSCNKNERVEAVDGKLNSATRPCNVIPLPISRIYRQQRQPKRRRKGFIKLFNCCKSCS